MKKRTEQYYRVKKGFYTFNYVWWEFHKKKIISGNMEKLSTKTVILYIYCTYCRHRDMSREKIVIYDKIKKKLRNV